MSIIGRSVPRLDAEEKVKGAARFGADLNRPDQAYMKILFSGRPHAIIRSIDTSAVEAMPGVVAVLTAKDVPVNEFGVLDLDQPVLCGPGSSKPYADRVRFVGDQVALVIAESEAIATEALTRLEVDYEDLPVLADPLAAMQEGAVLLHPDRGTNIFCDFHIRYGDVEQAFPQADAIVEAEYRMPAQEHILDPEAGLAYIDEEGRVTVEVGGQAPYEEVHQIAHSLGLPFEQVRVIYPAVGGGFGCRGAITIQIVLALAAWRLHQRGIKRPVKTVWSREESIIGHCKRHPFIVRAKWGATSEGKVVAAEMDAIMDGGPYFTISDRVLGNFTQTCTGPYEIPNVTFDGVGVYTNNSIGGAFRGFGSAQAGVVAEGQMNKLAEALDMDPVEFRLRNVLKEGTLRPLGSPLPPGVSIDKVIEACALHAGWRQAEEGWVRPDREALGKPDKPHLRRGIGLAFGFKNVGFSYGMPDESSAKIELQGGAQIEKAILYQHSAEIGQGVQTVQVQMAAEALNIPIEKVQLVSTDTSLAPFGGTSGASRMTFMAGNAIRGAAEVALAKWHNEDRPAIGTYRYLAPKTSMFHPETGQSTPSFAYGYAADAVIVEVDMETGQIRVVDVICAEDVGKAINPQQLEGQIEGAVVQAAGYALLEDFRQDGGYVQTDRLSTYLIPTILDIPERTKSVILEYPDPRGPWGARGAGEIPFLPFTPAVLAAVKDATGIWFEEFPLTMERVKKQLREAGNK